MPATRPHPQAHMRHHSWIVPPTAKLCDSDQPVTLPLRTALPSLILMAHTGDHTAILDEPRTHP